VVESWSPSALCLTHFGRCEDVGEQLERVRRHLAEWGPLARELEREGFVRRLGERVAESADDETRSRYEQAAPADQMYLGLERYWRKRAERETAAA
jgi:hypothetical protein